MSKKTTTQRSESSRNKAPVQVTVTSPAKGTRSDKRDNRPVHADLSNKRDKSAAVVKTSKQSDRVNQTKSTSRPQARFQTRKLAATKVAVLVLEELSREYPDVCNFSEAAALARDGETYLALLSVEDHGPTRFTESPMCSAETSARAVWAHAQASAVLKKLVDPSYDRWPETKVVWFRTEAKCARLNKKFDALIARYRRKDKPLPFSIELNRFYEALTHVLGEKVPEDEILQAAHYGPGSTVGVTGQDVNFVRKVGSNECTPWCVDLAARALVYDKATWAHLGLDPVYSHLDTAREGFIRVAREQLKSSVVSHDTLMFIHKGIKSLRSIGAQPTCSGMVQLGVHTVGTVLLKERANIDLSDQGWNQRLARDGSRDWESDDPLCTLDKSNASNLTALGLVQNLFPPNWAKFLIKTRTPGYTAPEQLGGGEHPYHMYAGMGNGTTFFIETLIFWAASYATQDLPLEEYVRNHDFAVYGDDVILRRSHAKRYMRFANWLGYEFNPKKTFLDGPFRESCGADFWAGIPVRPVSLDSESGFLDLPTLVSFHNNLADNTRFPLRRACERIRQLSKEYLYPILPTDPQGNQGFRPVDVPYYDIVRDARGRPILSEPWQRPRVFVLETRPKWGDLERLDMWTAMSVALLRARQDGPTGDLSLPIRGLVNYKVISERDLERDDLMRMLANQLRRLSVWKDTPWWNTSRGLV